MREIFLFANFSPHEIKTFKKKKKYVYSRKVLGEMFNAEDERESGKG